ncbi:ribbon-helix-helix domain-containing protein [Priestia megaterium]|nr:ribbon-helix-helix domain-containing protein [Priestia megaterium]AUO14822.1 ribbon-helix-helix domain-containing protein [Priestia megaterium]
MCDESKITKRNHLRSRKMLSNAVKNELYDKLKELSDETKVPMSKLLDEAIEDLLKKRG